MIFDHSARPVNGLTPCGLGTSKAPWRGFAVVWRRFAIEGQPAPLPFCVMVIVLADDLIRRTIESGEEEPRMPAIFDDDAWTVWLGEDGASSASARALRKTMRARTGPPRPNRRSRVRRGRDSWLLVHGGRLGHCQRCVQLMRRRLQLRGERRPFGFQFFEAATEETPAPADQAQRGLVGGDFQFCLEGVAFILESGDLVLHFDEPVGAVVTRVDETLSPFVGHPCSSHVTIDAVASAGDIEVQLFVTRLVTPPGIIGRSIPGWTSREIAGCPRETKTFA